MTMDNSADRFADLGDIEPEDAELPHELPSQPGGGARANNVEIEVPIAMSPAEVERRAEAVESAGSSKQSATDRADFVEGDRANP